MLFIATGSEVQIAVEAREVLRGEGINARVVSAPVPRVVRTSRTPSTRSRCCRRAVKARVSIEAGLALAWRKIVGDHGRSVSIEHFGASADYKTLFREFGMTTEHAVAAAKESLASL